MLMERLTTGMHHDDARAGAEKCRGPGCRCAVDDASVDELAGTTRPQRSARGKGKGKESSLLATLNV